MAKARESFVAEFDIYAFPALQPVWKSNYYSQCTMFIFFVFMTLVTVILYLTQFLPMNTATIWSRENLVSAKENYVNVDNTFMIQLNLDGTPDGFKIENYFKAVFIEAEYLFDENGKRTSKVKTVIPNGKCPEGYTEGGYYCYTASSGFSVVGNWADPIFRFVSIDMQPCIMATPDDPNCVSLQESHDMFFDEKIQKDLAVWTKEYTIGDDGLSLATTWNDEHETIFTPEGVSRFRMRTNAYFSNVNFINKRRWPGGQDNMFSGVNVKKMNEFTDSFKDEEYFTFYLRASDRVIETQLTRMSVARFMGIIGGLASMFYEGGRLFNIVVQAKFGLWANVENKRQD